MFSSNAYISESGPGQKSGWYFLKIDKDLSDYYNWFCSKSFRSWHLPLNGCHMTFIAGEKDDRIIKNEEIHPFLSESIYFEYENIIWTEGRSFWLPSYSSRLNEIRKELGLKPRNSFHITLGNLKNK